MSRLSGLYGERTYDPSSILDGDRVTVNVDVPGARLGDFCFPSFSIALVGLQMTANVGSADVVNVVTSNSTGGTVDLASGTLRVKVVPFNTI